MTGNLESGLGLALDQLPQRYKGPGGVAGVVKDGKVIARRVWGHADMAKRLAMTAETRLPICSISKQFTCALLLDQAPALLDPFVADYLPKLMGVLPTVQQLADNQSGLRDYWALTVLQGAFPEQEFRRSDALPMLARMKTGHFAAGTSYSYCNNNFRILGELIQRASGQELGALLHDKVFVSAGMETAVLLPDARHNADGVVGYEGNDSIGFLPAQNGIWWAGDAGISASLDDMLAWECYIDASRGDPAGIYNRLSVPPQFSDGSKAIYGNGLSHAVVAGRGTTGHGGALRGFRAHRRHVASERLSVVVMFNHEADAATAAWGLIEAALAHVSTEEAVAPEGWSGLWLDEADGLLVRTVPEDGAVTLHYATTPARLKLGADGVARSRSVSVERQGDALLMRRTDENREVLCRALLPQGHCGVAGIAGRYWSDEMEAWLEIGGGDGAAHAGFEGLLGRGPVERMYPVAKDVWIITTRRSMDASPPGDWTVVVEREAGVVTGLTLGCWLARGIRYRRS
ncbi:MAG: D-aminopeptidase [bacterium]